MIVIMSCNITSSSIVRSPRAPDEINGFDYYHYRCYVY